MKRRFNLYFLPLCLAAVPAFSAGPGTTAASFLKIPVGARETSLGGAVAAVADSANAVFYNPAGLALLGAPEAGYAYNKYFSGISQHWAAAALPRAYGTWGFGVNYLQVAPFASYDAQDNRTGSVSAYGLAAGLGYGRSFRTGLALAPALSCGAAAKYISENLDGETSAGAAADAGLLLSGPGGLKLGAGVENLASSRMDFHGAGARLSRKFKAGASYALTGRPVSALLSAELAFPDDGRSYFSAGLENTLYGALFLRAGYSSFGDVSGGLSFGLGLNLPERFGRGMRLDYSFGATYDLGSIQKFGLSWKFGQPPAASVPAAAPAPASPASPAAKDPETEFSARLEELYGPDHARSVAAAEALAVTDAARALVHFSAMLSSGKPEWKLAALRGLALSRDPGADAALAGALRDQDAEVRRQAAAAFGARPGPASAAALEEALKTEESEDVKSAILEALLKSRTP